MAQSKIINQYEAAALTGLSPALLAWLTSHAPKPGDKRKLKFVKKEKGIYYFDRDELTAFNAWLKAPWPQKDGKRPRIPDGIRVEVMTEANGACAICHGHKDACEAAHLDPVAMSKNNHPENLIWLCSSHHTVFDKGLYLPANAPPNFVAAIKLGLHTYKSLLWDSQAAISGHLGQILSACKSLKESLGNAPGPHEIDIAENLALDLATKLSSLAPVSKTDPKYAAIQSVDLSFASAPKKANVTQLLEQAEEAHQQYLTAFGYVVCPLCHGTGRHNGSECPFCQGEREVPKDSVSDFDPRRYEEVDCPLCLGEGTFEGDLCPVCHGDRRFERRYALQVDIRQYDRVSCPVCNGTGQRGDAICRGCGGNGDMQKHFADDIHMPDYDDVDCPLCKGDGRFRGETCPECYSAGQMEQHFAKQVDLTKYNEIACPLCKGTRNHRGETCPFCGGEGEIEQQMSGWFEARNFQDVECPTCEGSGICRGDTCAKCDGRGKLERRFLDL